VLTFKMFSTFRRLLKRSKDREVPQPTENDSYAEKNLNIELYNNATSAYIASKLPNRPHPGLAAEISRLRRQHRELQRRFKQLPPGRPYVRRTKLIAALAKMTEGSRPAAQPGKNLGRPLTSIDPSRLAARSAQRSKATKIPSYRGGASFDMNSVQKSASLEAETSLDTWHAKGAVPAANKEKPAVAPFKQAASQHRMRRLREWSLTHVQDAPGLLEEGGGEQDLEAASTKNQRKENASKSATTTTSSSSNDPRGASSSMKDKAWSIMAGLSLETLDKKRGVAAVEVTAGVNSSAATGAGGPKVGDRRRTEPLNNSQHVERKPNRGPSDSERQKEVQLGNGGTKRQKSSLVGRPRTRIGAQ